MNKTDLKNFVKLCKKATVDNIRSISTDFDNKVKLNKISEKYVISIEQAESIAKVHLYSNNSLEHIYNRYHDMKKDMKKTGGNLDFAKLATSVGDAKKLFDKHKGEIEGVIANGKDLIDKGKDFADKNKGPIDGLAGLAGKLTGEAKEKTGEEGEEGPSMFERATENSLNSIKKDVGDINKKLIILSSKIELAIGENAKEITKKIESVIRENAEENSKDIKTDLLKQIQERIDVLIAKLYPEISEAVANEMKKFSTQSGGSVGHGDCKCCDCAKDGYVFSDEENKKCS